MRNPFLRVGGILKNTAMDIGKDYTSNFQTLITDADQVKQSVMHIGTNASDTFTRIMKNGPIKSALDWFYTKEGETSEWDLDGADNDFDSGYDSDDDSSSSDEKEKQGPGTLDMDGMKDVAKGHINSMYKIAHKIAETQVANTAELVSTVNSRTSELIAATNNINTTLLGISKKLDSITSYVNARTYEAQKQERYNSLYDYNGRLTLGNVFDASKNAVENSSAASMFSLMKTMGSSGFLTPEFITRSMFDMFLGDKELKALGGQSINAVGNKINEAIGQGISDVLEKTISTDLFKKVFGDLTKESRSTNFKSYVKNEYNRDAAVFDGMTRISIVKTIPEYLKKIYEAVSGKVLNVDKNGTLTSKEGHTWKKAVGDTLYRTGAMNSEDLRGFLKTNEGAGLKNSQYDANTINILLTGNIVSYMLDEGITKPTAGFISPQNNELVHYCAQLLQAGGAAIGDNRTLNDWDKIVRGMLIYISSDMGRMNRFRGEITQKYQEVYNTLREKSNTVSDTQNVGSISMKLAAQSGVQNVVKRFQNKVPTPEVNNGPIQTFGNGDVPSIIGRGPGDVTTTEYTRSITDMISDIRTLLSASTQSLVGTKRYKNIESKLTKATPVQVETEGVIDYIAEEEDTYAKGPEKSDREKRQELIRDLKENKGGYIDSFKDAGSQIWGTTKDAFGNVVSQFRGPNGESNAVSDVVESGGALVSDAVGYGVDKAKQLGGALKDYGANALNLAKKYAGGETKEDIEDRETVSAINAEINMAINSGTVDQRERSIINDLLNSLHNKDLKRKLQKSTTAMMDAAASKQDPDPGKKGFFGKILSIAGLILSPVKLLAKGFTTLLPLAMKGFTVLARNVYGKEFRQIKEGLKGVGGGFKDLFSAFKEGAHNKVESARESITRRKEKKNEKSSDDDGSGGIIGSEETGYLKPPENQEMDDVYGDRKATKTKTKKQGKWAMFKEGFMSGFRGEEDEESATASTPVTVEGVDEPGEGFISKVLAKFVGIFKGDEDSIFKQVKEETEEIKENQEEEKDEAKNSLSSQGSQTSDQPDTGGVVTGLNGPQTSDGSGAVGTAFQMASNVSQTANTTSGLLGNASALLPGAASGITLEGSTALGALGTSAGAATLTGAAGAAGAAGAGVAGAAAAAAGPIGAIAAAVPVITKIGKAVGTIVKSLGGIGLAIGKIVIKTILLSKGFKAVFNTIKQFKDDIGKIIKLALEPLNKVFKLLKKIIKPVLIAIEDVLESLMKGIGKLLDSVLDVVIPLLDNILQPILNSIMPMVDTIVDILDPLFDLVGSLAEVALIPMAAQFKYILLPWVKMIGYYLQTLMGHVEIGFGAVMIPLGAIAAGIGTVLKGIGKIPKVGKGLKEAGENLEENGNNMMEQGWAMIEQGPKDIAAGVKGIVRTAVKAVMLEDQTENTDESTYIANPNANEYVSPGSVMDGTVTGNGNVDSHNNIWNISNVYGSGDSQKSYGNTLSMSTNGCGPMALADAYNRRTGGNVSGLSVASGMAKGGTYEPGRGTSVGSFMSASNSLGMNLKAGGVTASSLKNASPSNPVTVVGSGSDYGTKSGNNHFMNVIGTDSYGGAYVSNPLTGRVDRKSATTLASSSIMGLYGSGDTEDVYTFPDAVQNALSKLKNIAGTILGMFTKSATEDMRETMNKEKSAAEMERLGEDYDKIYGEGKYKEMEAEAEESAFTDWQDKNPRAPGETEEAYKKRFLDQYDDAQKWDAIARSTAYQEYQQALEDNANDTINASKNMGEGLKKLGEERRKIKLADDDSSSSGSRRRGGAGNFVEAVAKIFEGLVAKEPRLVYSNSDRYNIELRDGTQVSNVRPDCSGIIGAAIDSMGYGLQGGSATNLLTYSFGNNSGDNSIITDADGNPSEDWLIMPFDKDKKQPGDVILNTDHHMGMFIVPNPDNSGRNYGFDGGNTDAGSRAYTGEQKGGIHGSAKYATEYLDSSGSITDRYNGTVWSQPDVAIDGAEAPEYILRYVKSAGDLVGYTDKEKIWADLINNGATPEGAAGFMGVWEYEDKNNPNSIEGVYDFNDPTQAQWAEDAWSNLPDSMDNYVTNILFPTRYPGNRLSDGRALAVDAYKHDGHWYPGVGLAQWTGIRTKELIDYAKSIGEPANTVETQMDFFHNEQEKYSYLKDYYNQANNASTPEEAAELVVTKYQGAPSDTQKTLRGQYAREFYDLYKDWDNTDSDAMSPTGQGSVITGFGMVNSPSDAQAVNNMTAIGTTSGKNKGKVNTRGDGEPLGLRANPNNTMGNNVLVWIPDGTQLDLESTNIKGWYKTTYDGKTGYVNSTYIDLDIGNTTVSPNATKKQVQTKDTSTEDKLNEEIQSEYTKYFAGKQDPWNVFIPSVYPSKTDSQRWAAYGILGDEWRKHSNFGYSNDMPQIESVANKMGGYYLSADDINRYIGVRNGNAKQKEWSELYDDDRDRFNAYVTGLSSVVAPKTFEKYNQLYGSGDIDASAVLGDALSQNADDLVGLSSLMNSFNVDSHTTVSTTSSDEDIPDLDQQTLDKINAMNKNGGNGGVTIIKYDTSARNKVWDERLQMLLNNTYKVKSDRIEELLEAILDKLDDDDKPSRGGPSSQSSDFNMFSNNDIPQAVQRLMRG